MYTISNLVATVLQSCNSMHMCTLPAQEGNLWKTKRKPGFVTTIVWVPNPLQLGTNRLQTCYTQWTTRPPHIRNGNTRHPSVIHTLHVFNFIHSTRSTCATFIHKQKQNHPYVNGEGLCTIGTESMQRGWSWRRCLYVGIVACKVWQWSHSGRSPIVYKRYDIRLTYLAMHQENGPLSLAEYSRGISPSCA